MFFLESIGSIAIVVGLLVMYRKKGLTLAVLGISAVSYFLAIALKTVVQAFTLGSMEASFGYSSIPTSLYLGAQTVMFEVFGAYLFALAFRKYITQKSAEAYGLSLAFWENGILLGALSLISLLADFLIIASGPSSLSTLVSDQLHKASPGLFVGTLQALPLVGYSVLERLSSLLMHYSWGFLVVTSITYRKRLYLAYALPMGLVDSIVPFAGKLGIPLTEAIFFVIALLAIAVATSVKKAVAGMNVNAVKKEDGAGPQS